MSPLMSFGLATTALAGTITARYRVQTDNADAAQDSGTPRPTAPRSAPSSCTPAPPEQGRGGTLDLSV